MFKENIPNLKEKGFFLLQILFGIEVLLIFVAVHLTLQ